MLAVRDFDLDAISAHASQIQDELKRLFMRNDFVESLRFGTYYAESLRARIFFIRGLLEGILA